MAEGGTRFDQIVVDIDGFERRFAGMALTTPILLVLNDYEKSPSVAFTQSFRREESRTSEATFPWFAEFISLEPNELDRRPGA